MGLSTYKHRLRTEIEIGTWGTACAGLLFLISAFVEYYTRGDVTWISEIGCMVGIGTIAAVLVRARLFTLATRARKAFRVLRRN